MNIPATEAEPIVPLPPKENPQSLVLRGRPRPAVRFRRGLIVGMTGAFAVSLATISWLALEPPSFHKPAPFPNDSTSANGAAETLANVPRDYGSVPRLGPPLPGDLGGPILAHEQSLGPQPDASGNMFDGQQERRAVFDEERQRIAAARKAARSSPLLVQIESGHGAPTGPISKDPSGTNVRAGSAAVPARGRDGPELLFSAASDFDRDKGAQSPWTLSAGTIIPASLVTGLNSDLPGVVIAQVTENVRDSATGSEILIPQGARLIGSYDSNSAYGQRRVLLVWNRIVFPDGSSLGLGKMPAVDQSGYSGLEDKVDSHGWRLVKGIALSTLLGVGTELSLGSAQSDLVRAVRESAQQNASDAGQQLTVRNLDVRPTITVRPGWPVRAIVTEDLVLRP